MKGTSLVVTQVDLGTTLGGLGQGSERAVEGDSPPVVPKKTTPGTEKLFNC